MVELISQYNQPYWEYHATPKIPYMSDMASIERMEEGNFESYICSPGISSYMPLSIPIEWRRDTMKRTQDLFALSANEFVAEIWTQLLVRKLDKVNKPLYLFWDDEIPVPTPATALFWLLTCESWPMLDHMPYEGFDVTPLSYTFPYQSFVLPQSSNKLYSTHYPPEFSRTYYPWALTVNLEQALNQYMTREDRSRMAQTDLQTRVHRPQSCYTNYWSHSVKNKRRARLHQWDDNDGWPTVPIGMLDSGVAMSELPSAWYHYQELFLIRQQVMSSMIAQPGIPTHHNSLYTCPGGWIRGWSEAGIVMKDMMTLFWTEDKDVIRLEDSQELSSVPKRTPRIWLGFTHFGPKFNITPSGQPERIETASERWAKAYMKNRHFALAALFDSQNYPSHEIAKQQQRHRTSQLERAGRLTKKGSDSVDFREQMKAAFNSVIGVKKES